jgi:hypothetical protein
MAGAEQLGVVRLDKCKVLFTRCEYALLLADLKLCHQMVVCRISSLSGIGGSLEHKMAGTTCAQLYQRLVLKNVVGSYAKKEFAIKLLYSELLAIYIYLLGMRIEDSEGDYEYVTYVSLIGKIFKACSDNKLL